MSPAKTAELIEVPFRTETRGFKKPYIMRGHDPPKGKGQFGKVRRDLMLADIPGTYQVRPHLIPETGIDVASTA